MKDSVISANNLSVAYANQLVLNKVNFSVAQGQIFALLGGNGAGKSTTLKTFLGTLKPQSGSANILGKPVHQHINTSRKQIAYLPESVMLYGHLTAIENIQYFLSLADIKQSVQQIEDALTQVSLQPQAWHNKLSQYSKGMRQKTAIALALLRQAPILFLDEPTSGLDPAAIDEFNQLMSQLAQAGSTIFMVTHDVYGACQVANKIGLLHQGELISLFNAEHNQSIDTETVHKAFVRGIRA
ncbi:ABC transporter ATP-binding protein [Catenovulum agarivorans]|uniref:ABC transporter ATP-binding protein n=1 Tax=Catenovulum agarivorans TaxID=1172192 RepID=UPI000316A6CD|nr:ABC transporter ATP-binding protein [Catenovulum agarivorans]